MGKLFESKGTFQFSWDQVARAFWHRYPNPHSKHVLSEDILWREVKGNKLYSKRLFTKTNLVPDWGKRFIKNRATVCIVEESVLDPTAKTITTYTRNIGFNRMMSVEEKCTYRQNEDCNNWTTVDRTAWITSSFYVFANAFQNFGFERFRKNTIKANKGFQYVLENMYRVAEKPVESTSSGLQVNLKATAKKASELAKAAANVHVQNSQ